MASNGYKMGVRKSLLIALAVFAAGLIGFIMPSLSKGSFPSAFNLVLFTPLMLGLGVFFFFAVYRGQKKREMEINFELEVNKMHPIWKLKKLKEH